MLYGMFEVSGGYATHIQIYTYTIYARAQLNASHYAHHIYIKFTYILCGACVPGGPRRMRMCLLRVVGVAPGGGGTVGLYCKILPIDHPCCLCRVYWLCGACRQRARERSRQPCP
jgi:hypothetical protein